MNIFLVEDEHWALAEMVELFKAYEAAHSVYTFDNGDDALSAASKVRPHLVLTDINMPGIDGLELIKKLNQLDPSIKSMIISVHDRFEYARQGMHFGVYDYLLKPVKKDALFKAVDKAMQHIENDSKQREEWMNGSITQMLLTADIPEYDVLRAVNGRSYCMVLLVLEQGKDLNNWKEFRIHCSHFKKCFANKLLPETEIHCLDLDCLHRVVLIPLKDVMQSGHVTENLSLLYQQLKQLEAPVHLGFAVKSGKNSLYETFAKLKQTVEEQMTFGMPSFLTSGTKNQDVEIGSVWEKVRVMEIHYKKGEIGKGQENLHQILEELRQKQITKRQLRLFIRDVLFSLRYHLLPANAGMAGMNDAPEDVEVLNRFSGYVQLFEWLNDQIVSLYGRQEPMDANPKRLVPVLLQLIHDHYQGSISLQQFAAHHHVSLGYLSRMFKSQTGLTFSEYMAAYRIRKAKELLSSGVERLQDVSHLVGYEDTKHFSHLFKKIVGETPIMYAKRNATKQASMKNNGGSEGE
ncbi:response regulator transcription factor [Paenibacillus agricola]|uniref:Response regulator n=1 Tax=Paenibacillus agricola TaxID=2716264 RepID=A0ABX0JCM1_9BACL|nr:response regulator [Paenibacillus agricola]NHN33698.1 response regulator [Paenibacillus agricola]